MKLIKTIQFNEELKSEEIKNFKVRKAARAIVFDEDNKIGLLFVAKYNYHKLPGGGIKDGEDIIEALDRECLEEIGCHASVYGELGEITEYRDKWELKQHSFCYLANVASEKGEPSFTQKELDGGFEIKWVTLDEAIDLLKADKPNDYEGEYIQIRDSIFLEEARNKMNSLKRSNCLIIHGCPADKEKAMDPVTRTYDKHWLPWTKRELDKMGIETKIPLMPDPWEPVYEKFKQEFEKLEINEDTVLIGTSCGCTFLVRWLGDTKRKVKKLILVAPWKINENSSEFAKKFYDFPIDESIKDRVGEIVMFTADNESEDGKQGLKMFHNALSGEIISIDGNGHYIMKHMGTEKFPELINVVIK